METALRTDESFATGDSPLSDLNIGMISVFPLDYMHLCLLGVTKKKHWLLDEGGQIELFF